MMRRSAFRYEPEVDGYRCPEGQLLRYATTDRTGYRHYRSDPAVCRTCSLPAPPAPTPFASSPAMSGRTSANAPTACASRRGARPSTPASRRPSNAPSPTPRSCTATAMPASDGCGASASSACSPPQPRTSRRSHSPSPPGLTQGRPEEGRHSSTSGTRPTAYRKQKTPPRRDGVCQRSEGGPCGPPCSLRHRFRRLRSLLGVAPLPFRVGGLGLVDWSAPDDELERPKR